MWFLLTCDFADVSLEHSVLVVSTRTLWYGVQLLPSLSLPPCLPPSDALSPPPSLSLSLPSPSLPPSLSVYQWSWWRLWGRRVFLWTQPTHWRVFGDYLESCIATPPPSLAGKSCLSTRVGCLACTMGWWTQSWGSCLPPATSLCSHDPITSDQIKSDCLFSYSSSVGYILEFCVFTCNEGKTLSVIIFRQHNVHFQYCNYSVKPSHNIILM